MAEIWQSANGILLQAVFRVLVAGAGFSLAAGLWLLVSPAGFAARLAPMNRWFSLRRILKPLEVPRATERLLYRHHKILGTFLVLGSTYTLYWQTFHFSRLPVRSLLLSVQPWLRDALVESTALFLFFGNLCAFGIGIIVLLRPSLLKGLEESANRWISTRRMPRALEQPRADLDDILLVRHPRLTGVFVVLGSLYILLMAAVYG